MGFDSKLARNFSLVEPQKLGFMVVIGCFLVSMVFLTVYETDMNLMSIVKLRVNMSAAPTTMLKVTDDPEKLGSGSENTIMPGEKTPVANVSTTSDVPGHNGSISPMMRTSMEQFAMVSRNNTRKNPLITTAPSHKRKVGNTSTELGEATRRIENLVKNRYSKSICDLSQPRTDVCEMDGDVRIHGRSSTIIYVTTSITNESWRVKPYARKEDKNAMGHVNEVLLKSYSTNQRQQQQPPPPCSINHSIPAIVFSGGGYAGNLYHDFTDTIIPLFLTSRRYNGEVQFLITNMQPWWNHKYNKVLNSLSHYEIVDFDNDDRVHCYPHAIVGLWRHKELSIDPSRHPNGHSMAEFAQFMRTSFFLKRDYTTKRRKPRLLIITRKRTRKFTNLDEIVDMSKRLGYKVVAREAGEAAEFAAVVNSCDLVMGVHGAGLTNIVFLPANATVMQIVPWGRLEGVARFCFKEAAVDMKLRYMEYSIKEEESSLVEMYTRDDPVFKDPMAIHRKGWDALKEVYLEKQDVRIDVKRIQGVLLEAMKLFHDDH